MVVIIDKSFKCITDSKIQLSYLFFTLPKQPCYCEASWNEIVCKNKEKYMKMSKEVTPSLCICQKYSHSNEKCLQFMMRCVARNRTSQKSSFKKSYSVKNNYKYKVSLGKRRNNLCSCCFNQPDEYCDHFSCNEMVPYFEKDKETSCNCFTTLNFPYYICNSSTSSGIESEGILNSPVPGNFKYGKKDKISGNYEIDKDYNVISSELKKNSEKASTGMRILTNGIVINICGGLVLIFVVGLIACFVANNTKKSSQRSRSQIVDPNTEFLMDQRTNV
uniref:Plasmodium vivax Vir protein n=1 Tax=Strongyloides venezuelensis TaxID=75913 RepID=A0A0K0FIM3_STRVS